MAVTASYTPVETAGNGVTTAFSFSFKIFAQTDITVYVRGTGGALTTKTLTTHYTVSFDTDAETGTVTMLTAPASGEYCRIVRNTARTQGTSFPREGVTPAKSVENALDKLTLQTQELYRLIDGNAEFLTGLYADKAAAPTVWTFYYSTDAQQTEMYVPAQGAWKMLA